MIDIVTPRGGHGTDGLLAAEDALRRVEVGIEFLGPSARVAAEVLQRPFIRIQRSRNRQPALDYIGTISGAVMIKAKSASPVT